MGLLIAGTAEGFHHRAKKGIKGASVISAGAVLIKDAALTPDGWIVATAGVTAEPFGILLNKDAGASDTVITVGLEGEFSVVADGAIEPNTFVMSSATTAGRVIAWNGTNESAKVGLYVGHKGGSVPEAAVQNDVINIIKEAT